MFRFLDLYIEELSIHFQTLQVTILHKLLQEYELNTIDTTNVICVQFVRRQNLNNPIF